MAFTELAVTDDTVTLLVVIIGELIVIPLGAQILSKYATFWDM